MISVPNTQHSSCEVELTYKELIESKCLFTRNSFPLILIIKYDKSFQAQGIVLSIKIKACN